MLPQSPGLFTMTIAAIVSPRKTSTEIMRFPITVQPTGPI